MLTCKICFEATSASVGGNRARITICGHVFCEDCAGQWFQTETACPVCRKTINQKQGLISIFDNDGVQVSDSPSSLGDDSSYGKSAIDKALDVRGDEEHVQVRYVLGKVADRWQEVMVERAKLRSDVAHLETVQQDLENQLLAMKVERDVLMKRLQDVAVAAYRLPIRAEDSVPSGLDRDAETSHHNNFQRGLPRRSRPGHKVEDRLRAPKWELIHTYNMHTDPVHGIAVSPAGTLIATASWDHLCRVYDIHSQEEVMVLKGHSLGLYAVKFSSTKPDLLGTVSSDQTCRLWNSATGDCLAVLEGHVDEVNGLSFQQNSQLLATASDDMTAMIWDAEKSLAVTQLHGHQNVVYGVCFQPQGPLLATASFDWTAKLWDPRSGEDVQTLQGHDEDVIGVDMDESGYYLATGSDDTTCRIWDIRMAQTLAVLQEHSGEVKRVVFSPYSRLLVTTSGDATVRLFNSTTFECQHVLSSHTDHVFDAAWSPRAEFLVTASHDKTWKMWKPVVLNRRVTSSKMRPITTS